MVRRGAGWSGGRGGVAWKLWHIYRSDKYPLCNLAWLKRAICRKCNNIPANGVGKADGAVFWWFDGSVGQDGSGAPSNAVKAHWPIYTHESRVSERKKQRVILMV